MNHRLVNSVINPIVKPLLRSPLHSLLPKYWALLTYTGRRTHKRYSFPIRVARYKDEFIVVPGCFDEIPAAWWRNFRTESLVDLRYRGKSMECFARAIEDEEPVAVPRLAAYLRHFPSEQVGITVETPETVFQKLVTAAAKTYPIVTIRPCSNKEGGERLGN